MIFQEPMTALNPVLPVRLQIEENLQAHTTLDGRARRARALELMNIVGIPAAERRLDQYPHQFSGGMRQRVMIAIALASSPRLLLADEPTTALDVTIQDQILKLILDLRDRFGMSVLFVTHDLGVVAATCDRMAVMYAGRIVETGSVAAGVRRAASSLYARPAGIGAAHRCRAHHADVDRRDAAEPDRAARRLRLPSALRLCHRSHAAPSARRSKPLPRTGRSRASTIGEVAAMAEAA